MLSELQLRNFRCFEAVAIALKPQTNFLVGSNGQGKTSILEAACVLLRLQSQRSSSLGPVVRQGHKSFSVAGRWNDHLLQFGYSHLRRKILFDAVEQRTAADYLSIARVVSFANTDIELARGGADARRRYLDFLGAQTDPRYRPTLRAYERALRSRNALLKNPHVHRRQVAAYDAPLINHGTLLAELRSALVAKLAPVAEGSHHAISGRDEQLTVTFVRGYEEDFVSELAASEKEEARLRQTLVGPHRDDLAMTVQRMAVGQYASEGQQRTVVLSLKLAQARVLAENADSPPLLLIDDIFGELDQPRRNALLHELPIGSQKLITATSLDWRSERDDAPVLYLRDGRSGTNKMLSAGPSGGEERTV